MKPDGTAAPSYASQVAQSSREAPIWQCVNWAFHAWRGRNEPDGGHGTLHAPVDSFKHGASSRFRERAKAVVLCVCVSNSQALVSDILSRSRKVPESDCVCVCVTLQVMVYGILPPRRESPESDAQCVCHTPSTAFRHLPPNSARFSYVTEGALFYLRAAVHRRGQRPPKGSGTNHTPSIAFRHLPPNAARFSYATEGALFISAQLSTDAVSALRKVWVLI